MRTPPLKRILTDRERSLLHGSSTLPDRLYIEWVLTNDQREPGSVIADAVE